MLTFWIALIPGVLGFIGTLFTIPQISTYAFWFLFAGFFLLVLALMVKGSEPILLSLLSRKKLLTR